MPRLANVSRGAKFDGEFISGSTIDPKYATGGAGDPVGPIDGTWMPDWALTGKSQHPMDMSEAAWKGRQSRTEDGAYWRSRYEELVDKGHDVTKLQDEIMSLRILLGFVADQIEGQPLLAFITKIVSQISDPVAAKKMLDGVKNG